MDNTKGNLEVIHKLFYGLPDARICKVALKVTVVSDNGTKIIIKERRKGNCSDNNIKSLLEVPVFLYKPLEYKDLDNVIRKLEHKEVVITSMVYRNSMLRKLLATI